MRDLFVHIRMKACCQKVLAEIDKEKKKARSRSGILGAGLLVKLLGEKTIDAAKAAIPDGGAMPPEGISGVEMERVTRQVCAKLCAKHAEEHEPQGEAEEAEFWRDLETAFHCRLLALPTDTVSLEKVATLKESAKGALKKYVEAPHQLTAAIASAMGHLELDGKLPHEQLAYLKKNGRQIAAKTAQKMANQGRLVIAGFSDGRVGHTAVVMPGRGRFKIEGNAEHFYPNLLSGAPGGVGSPGYSNGSKSAADVWPMSKLDSIGYWEL